MALTIGTITVDENGDATGSGLALAIFQGALAAVPVGDRAVVAEGMAPFCVGIATAIVNHFKDNAEIKVTVSTSDAGLQRTPDPNNPNTATLAPAAPVELSGTIE